MNTTHVGLVDDCRSPFGVRSLNETNPQTTNRSPLRYIEQLNKLRRLAFVLRGQEATCRSPPTNKNEIVGACTTCTNTFLLARDSPFFWGYFYSNGELERPEPKREFEKKPVN